MKYILLTIITSFSLLAEAPKLPNIENYTWNKCEKIKGYFLSPNHWYFKKHQKNKTLGYFITKEELKTENSHFETGITINVIKDIKKEKGISPSVFTKQYISSIKTKLRIYNEFNTQNGPFTASGFRYEQLDQKNNKIYKFHNLLISNDSTGTLYFVIFESPKQNWDTEWKVAEKVLKMLYIDSSI